MNNTYLLPHDNRDSDSFTDILSELKNRYLTCEKSLESKKTLLRSLEIKFNDINQKSQYLYEVLDSLKLTFLSELALIRSLTQDDFSAFPLETQGKFLNILEIFNYNLDFPLVMLQIQELNEEDIPKIDRNDSFRSTSPQFSKITAILAHIQEFKTTVELLKKYNSEISDILAKIFKEKSDIKVLEDKIKNFLKNIHLEKEEAEYLDTKEENCEIGLDSYELYGEKSMSLDTSSVLENPQQCSLCCTIL